MPVGLQDNMILWPMWYWVTFLLYLLIHTCCISASWLKICSFYLCIKTRDFESKGHFLTTSNLQCTQRSPSFCSCICFGASHDPGAQGQSSTASTLAGQNHCTLKKITPYRWRSHTNALNLPTTCQSHDIRSLTLHLPLHTHTLHQIHTKLLSQLKLPERTTD